MFEFMEITHRIEVAGTNGDAVDSSLERGLQVLGAKDVRRECGELSFVTPWGLFYGAPHPLATVDSGSVAVVSVDQRLWVDYRLHCYRGILPVVVFAFIILGAVLFDSTVSPISKLLIAVVVPVAGAALIWAARSYTRETFDDWVRNAINEQA